MYKEDLELVDDEVVEDELLDDETEETTDEELDNTDDEPVKKNDKVPISALLKQKEANKALKMRLAELEQKEAEKELESRKQKIIDQLIEKGYDEVESRKMADNDAKVEKLEQAVELMRFEKQADKLEDDFPNVHDDLKQLMAICQKTGWSLKKVCVAEYGDSETYDQTVSKKQEAILKKQKSAKAKPVTPSNAKLESVKLDSDVERRYQIYAKKNPGITRKQYQERLTIQTTIPHDRWE